MLLQGKSTIRTCKKIVNSIDSRRCPREYWEDELNDCIYVDCLNNTCKGSQKEKTVRRIKSTYFFQGKCKQQLFKLI